jgi:hypothetical protein
MKTGRILALSGLFLLAFFAGATAADRKIAAVDGVVPGAGTGNSDSLWDRTIQDVQKAYTAALAGEKPCLNRCAAWPLSKMPCTSAIGSTRRGGFR